MHWPEINEKRLILTLGGAIAALFTLFVAGSYALSKLLRKPTGKFAMSQSYAWDRRASSEVRAEIAQRMDRLHFVFETEECGDIVGARPASPMLVDGIHVETVESLPVSVRVTTSVAGEGVVVKATAKAQSAVVFGVQEAAYINYVLDAIGAPSPSLSHEPKDIQQSQWTVLAICVAQLALLVVALNIKDPSVNAGFVWTLLTLAILSSVLRRQGNVRRTTAETKPRDTLQQKLLPFYPWFILFMGAVFWLQRFVLVDVQ